MKDIFHLGKNYFEPFSKIDLFTLSIKKLLILIAIMSIEFACYAQRDLLPVKLENLTFSGDRAYYQNTPFTGLCYQKLGAQKTLSSTFKNGYREGNYTEWHQNGIKKNDLSYVNGQIADGEYAEWDNKGKVTFKRKFVDGRLLNLTQYQNGKKNGMANEYYSNGALKSECNYKDDLLNGTLKEISINGITTYKVNYTDGNRIGEEAFYDENTGKIRNASIFDSIGNLAESIAWKYTKNGNIISELRYNSKGDYHGICIDYWEDGSIKWKRKYMNGIVISNLIENPNDPEKSIKKYLERNPSAVIGLADKISPLYGNKRRANILIKNETNSYGNSSVVNQSIHDYLFNFRLNQVNRYSQEPLDYELTISNYSVKTFWNDGKVNVVLAVVQLTPGYQGLSSIDVTLRDINAGTEISRTLDYEGKTLWQSESNAINQANQSIGATIADFLYQQFPLQVQVGEVIERDRKENAKTVRVNNGSDDGVYNSATMEVFDVKDSESPSGNVIGHLEVINLGATSCICKVKDGEEKITYFINTYKILKGRIKQ